MENLSHTDILALNNAIGEVYAARDLESFYSAAFRSIQSIIACDNCSYNDIEMKIIRFSKVISPSHDHNALIQKLFPSLNAHLHEHPLAGPCLSDNIVKITDFVSTKEFKNLAIYNEFYRHLDTEIQMTMSILKSDQTRAVFALSRSRTDFSERERLLMKFLKPHISGAFRNVTEFEQLQRQRDLLLGRDEEQRQGVVLCRKGGWIILISELAREMFRKYFGILIEEGFTLPEPLLLWLAAETALRKAVRQVERKAFVIETNGKRLTIKLMNDVTTGDFILNMTENDPAVLFRNLQQYCLSPRENEVLDWLAKGKTNVEIAVILGISKRTADKHLENIFAKLGVETRAAAVAIIRNECDLH